MDAALRVLHVVLGIFWAGTVTYASLILFPQLKALGPAVERPALTAIMRATSPTMAACSVTVLGTGIAMIWRAGVAPSALLATGWGLAMLVALVATLVCLAVGFGVLMPAGMRMLKLGRSIEGRQPTAEESERMERLTRRIAVADRVNALGVVVAATAMPLSHFV